MKKNHRIKSAMSAQYADKHYETNTKPSMTVPGQSMTIQEMVARHRKGLPIDQSKGALYTGSDDPAQDLSQMDLIDRQAYIDSVADALVEVRMRIDEQAKTKQEKEIVAKADKMFRDKLAEFYEKNQAPASGGSAQAQKP